MRGLLCPPNHEELRTLLVRYVHASGNSGDGYRLADYPLVWLDSDAVAWNVQQAARMERFADDSLPFWQRAYDLASRGIYLVDEPYSQWAEERRAEVEADLRQSVHALARLYVARRKEAGEAEALLLLRTYWQRHPSDEDALRPLLELLGKQERYQEALGYYQQLCEVLEEEERQPDLRTQDIAEYVRTKQIQRERGITKVAKADESVTPPPSTQAHTQHDAYPGLSQAIRQGIVAAVCELEGTLHLDTPDSVARRILMAKFLGIPSTLLTLDWNSIKSLADVIYLPTEDTFALYEDILIMSRACLDNGGPPIATGMIDEHLQKLALLARNAPEQEREHWQSLLCRFYHLSSSVARRDMNKKQALSTARCAIDIATELEDVELIACSFFRRGRIHLEQSNAATDEAEKRRHILLAKADIDAALDFVERVRTPLRGNIYLIAAEVNVLLAGSSESVRIQCQHWQDTVTELVYRGNIEEDNTFLHLNTSALHHERAKTLLHFGQLQEARGELTEAWKTLQPNLLSWHIYFHLTEANLYKAEHDFEGSAKAGMAAYTIAQALPSRKGEAGVKSLFADLEQRDAHHPYVHELGTLLGMS